MCDHRWPSKGLCPQCIKSERRAWRRRGGTTASPDAYTRCQRGSSCATMCKYGPTARKLRWNPVGCWHEVTIAVYPFRTGTLALIDPRQTNVQNSRLDIKTCKNS